MPASPKGVLGACGQEGSDGVPEQPPSVDAARVGGPVAGEDGPQLAQPQAAEGLGQREVAAAEPLVATLTGQEHPGAGAPSGLEELEVHREVRGSGEVQVQPGLSVVVRGAGRRRRDLGRSEAPPGGDRGEQLRLVLRLPREHQREGHHRRTVGLGPEVRRRADDERGVEAPAQLRGDGAGREEPGPHGVVDRVAQPGDLLPLVAHGCCGGIPGPVALGAHARGRCDEEVGRGEPLQALEHGLGRAPRRAERCSATMPRFGRRGTSVSARRA